MADEPTELGAEQRYVDQLYARLDELRTRTESDLAAVRRQRPTGTHQNRSERDAFAAMYEQRLGQLRGVEDRLCFGRFDLRGGARRYVGRIGLSDEDRHQLLIDWRAPAARLFYQATAAAPADVVRRRHLTTRGRAVVAIEDEVLDLDHIDRAELAHLTGEGALLAALNAHRTGRMGDIVATIQAEQDEVIRSELGGVLVVQGGPGTGKTAVALHRAAYLLYTYRDRLERRGVLVVGPNQVFLRYIEKVLPSLGETGVVMASLGALFPGVTAEVDDAPAAAAVKGSAGMAGVLAAAVRARQRVPSSAIKLDVEGHELLLRPHVVAAAQDRARRGGRPHNVARVGYVKELLEQLASQYARVLGIRLEADSRRELLAELRASRDVRREVNLTWMPLTPQRLLEDLYAEPHLLREAAPRFTQAELDALHRPRGSAWTVSDIPLLDEAAELIGVEESTSEHARAAAAERRAAVEYARGALQLSGAGAFVSAEQLADRFSDAGPTLSTAERAIADRTWAYGHVVVDEAQELSPMAWRMLMRRCPTKSMTLVGDVAQTGSAAGASSWQSALGPHVGRRWRLAQLTVNYRTPGRVMRLATSVLRAAGVDAPAPTSAREGDFPPLAQRIAPDDATALVSRVRGELDVVAGGKLAVITAASQTAAVHAELAAALPAATVGHGAGSLDAAVAVLSVGEAKGLEFDAVVLVEPARILRESPRGANDLYVAISRPTQRLLVLHSEPLPPGFESLAG
ncbi:MAG TPA: AAA family ATPase [Acidothermaceae bacterium]